MVRYLHLLALLSGQMVEMGRLLTDKLVPGPPSPLSDHQIPQGRRRYQREAAAIAEWRLE